MAPSSLARLFSPRNHGEVENETSRELGQRLSERPSPDQSRPVTRMWAPVLRNLAHPRREHHRRVEAREAWRANASVPTAREPDHPLETTSVAAGADSRSTAKATLAGPGSMAGESALVVAPAKLNQSMGDIATKIEPAIERKKQIIDACNNKWLSVSLGDPRILADVSKFSPSNVQGEPEMFRKHWKGSMLKIRYKFPSGKESEFIFRSREPGHEIATYLLNQHLSADVIVPTAFAVYQGKPGVVMGICGGAHPIRRGEELFFHPTLRKRNITSSEIGQVLKKMSKISSKKVEDLSMSERKLFEDYKYIWYDIGSSKVEDGQVIANYRYPRFDLTDPLAKRQLTWLHVVDLLVGMSDRHPYNYFVEVSKWSGRVSRVRGIDNEGAFTGFDLPGGTGVSMLKLGMVEVIDEEMRDKILGLSHDDHRTLFQGILPLEKINAAEKMLDIIQDKIRSGEIKVIGNDQWGVTELRNPGASYSARDGNPHRLPI